MIQISKILLTCLILIFSSLSSAENTKSNEISLSTSEASKHIDINSADIKTLSLLKGVGMKKAEAIVKYRDVNGKFSTIDELLNVNGIGKKIFALNKTKLTI
jgi:competence protein ComEA